MTMIRRACAKCGRIAEPGTSRCALHPKRKPRSRAYFNAARLIRTTATVCALCGEGPREDDPWVADHRIPREHGGSDGIENLQPAHRSCNGRNGQAIGELNW
jgi:5-methylcytosine-specific restriction endonuclease McrA